MTGLRKFTVDGALLFIVFRCVYSSNIQLGGVADAGLRPDDLLIGFALVLLALRGAFNSTHLSTPFKPYVLFILINLLV